jgi:isoamylase
VPMADADWRDPNAKALLVWLHGGRSSMEPELDGQPRRDGRLLIMVNASEVDVEMTMPGAVFGVAWEPVLSTDHDVAPEIVKAGETVPVRSRSLAVFEEA